MASTILLWPTPTIPARYTGGMWITLSMTIMTLSITIIILSIAIITCLSRTSPSGQTALLIGSTSPSRACIFSGRPAIMTVLATPTATHYILVDTGQVRGVPVHPDHWRLGLGILHDRRHALSGGGQQFDAACRLCHPQHRLQDL